MDVASTQLGRMLSARRETGVHARPYLRNRDVQWGHVAVTDLPTMDFSPEDEARFRLASGDVLVCEGGEVGRAAIWRDQLAECYYQKALHRVRVSEALSPGYLRYLLEHYARTKAFAELTSGSTIAHLPQEDLRNLLVILPPRDEQDRIVAAIEQQFSRVDAGAAALDRARHNLKRMQSAVLGDLLSDSDGCAWQSVPLGEILEHGRYGTSTKCAYDGQGLPVLRIPNIQSGKVDLRDLKRAVDCEVDLWRTLIEEGDVLIIRTNGSRSLIGRAAVVPVQNEALSFASYLIQLKVNYTLLLPHYLVAALAAPQVRVRVERLAATSAGQYNISLGKLRSLKIPLPPLEDQAALLKVADRRITAIAGLESDLVRAQRRHERLRSSILAAAFSGRLVPQDRADESASTVLERIAIERASSKNGYELGRTGKSRKRVTL